MIGINPDRLGLKTDLFTGVAGENLKWTSLIIKKIIPSCTFSKIYIYSPQAFYTDDGDIDPGSYHTVCKILKEDGVFYLSQRADNSEFKKKLVTNKFIFREFNDMNFSMYSKHPLVVKYPKVKRYTGGYKLLDLDWDIPLIKDLTLNDFIKELDNNEFIVQFTSSIKNLLSYKRTFYLGIKGDTKKKFDFIQRKIKNLKTLGIDPATIKEMYPMYEFYAGFLFDLDELIVCLSNDPTPDKTKKNLLEAIFDSNRGLGSLVGRNKIKDKIVSQLYAFSQNWKVFSGNFCNYALMGKSGVGKTRLGQVISFVFSKSGVLATDNIYIVSRADLVGQYIGQTAPRTRSLLLSSLEGCIFIDEAYQLSGCSKDFGHEAITEIVNFTDKYVGMSIVIVAGYHDKMKKDFFPSNEGLERRFPHQLILGDYTTTELTDILITFLSKSINIPELTRNILFTMIVKINKEIPAAFDKQAGDMLNLGGVILVSIYSSKMKWKDSYLPILYKAFSKFLQTKGFQGYKISG